MSPSEAPLSKEPYCATACFSSAISSALIDTVMRRLCLSRLMTAPSTLLPTFKGLGLCLDAVVLDCQHLAGDLTALAQLTDGVERVAADLLDAEADALLGGIDVEH